MKLLVEGFAFRQHGVDDRGEFFRDQRAGDWFSFAALPSLKLGFDVGELLDRENRRVMERDLEIPMPIARALVARLAARVMRSGHQAAVGVEVADGGKPRDVVNLEQLRIPVKSAS